MEEIKIDLGQVADVLHEKLHGEPYPARDKSKWHVTSLVRAADEIVKGRNVYQDGIEGEVTGIMSLGRIWELIADVWLAYYAEQNHGTFTPDVEIEQDGILCSLDGMMFLPEAVYVVESKLRFTLKEDIPFKHMQQIRAYCHVAGVYQVLFPILNISSAPPTAWGRLVHMDTTRESAAETWEMVVNTKKHLESLGITCDGGEDGNVSNL